MKRLICILLFLLAYGARAQTWNNTGTANLQRQATAKGYFYRNNMGALGNVPWYTKAQLDSIFTQATGKYIINQSDSTQTNASFSIDGIGSFIDINGNEVDVSSIGVNMLYGTENGGYQATKLFYKNGRNTVYFFSPSQTGQVDNIITGNPVEYNSRLKIDSIPVSPTDAVRLQDLSAYPLKTNTVTVNGNTQQLGSKPHVYCFEQRGSVTNITSTTPDITIANPTTTPALTLAKLNGNNISYYDPTSFYTDTVA